jgi:hypothetical protein
MKYLKLYEAFKSKGISNTIKFLKDKVGSTSSTGFINSLRDFMLNIDFPINEISDDNLKYLSAKKAMKLKNESDVTNPKGIWVIKYWFSLENGFLGYSATGNERKEIDNTISGSGKRSAEKFTDSDLEYIRQNIISSGEIWPVTDYSKLKTGDSVIGQFNSHSQRDIGMAKIFVDQSDNNRVYAIQSVSSGSHISDSRWRNYTNYGDLTWWLYDNTDMGNDHRKLHYWRPSSEELNYIEPPKEIEEVEQEKEENPLTWNLPLSNRYSFSSWGRGSSISKDSIEKADFALVLYFDDLVATFLLDVESYERPSEIKQQRREEKEGATKLMSDDEIKKMNIERYIQKLVVSLNITETEFFNLEKIVSKHLCKEFSYISIFYQRPDWSDLSDFTEYLYKVIDSHDDKSYYLDKVKDIYKRRTENYYNQFLKYQTNKTFLKGDSQLKKFFDELFKLGGEINTTFTKKELSTIDDLWLTSKKIRSLYEYIKMSRNQFNYQVREVMGGFRYTDEMGHYFTQYENQYTEENYKQDLERINRIRGFMKSL